MNTEYLGMLYPVLGGNTVQRIFWAPRKSQTFPGPPVIYMYYVSHRLMCLDTSIWADCGALRSWNLAGKVE